MPTIQGARDSGTATVLFWLVEILESWAHLVDSLRICRQIVIKMHQGGQAMRSNKLSLCHQEAICGEGCRILKVNGLGCCTYEQEDVDLILLGLFID